MARPNIFALTLVGALGASACMGTVRLEQSLPTTVAPLSTVKTLEVTGEDGVVLLRGTLNGESTNNERNGKTVRTVTLASPSGPAPDRDGGDPHHTRERRVGRGGHREGPRDALSGGLPAAGGRQGDRACSRRRTKAKPI